MTTFMHFEHETERILYVSEPSFIPRVGETITIDKWKWRVRSVDYEYKNGNCYVTLRTQ